eukprot:7609101-Lingulodinium_polyedra.AAC.1
MASTWQRPASLWESASAMLELGAHAHLSRKWLCLICIQDDGGDVGDHGRFMDHAMWTMLVYSVGWHRTTTQSKQ